MFYSCPSKEQEVEVEFIINKRTNSPQKNHTNDKEHEHIATVEKSTLTYCKKRFKTYRMILARQSILDPKKI